MGIKLLLKDVEALEAMFANGNKLSVKRLKAIEGAAVGHGQKSVDARRIAKKRRFVSLLTGERSQLEKSAAEWVRWSGESMRSRAALVDSAGRMCDCMCDYTREAATVA